MSAPQREGVAATLPRELRLSDLVLLQVLLIVLWLAAIALFYFPLAGTVIYLIPRAQSLAAANLIAGAQTLATWWASSGRLR